MAIPTVFERIGDAFILWSPMCDKMKPPFTKVGAMEKILGATGCI